MQLVGVVVIAFSFYSADPGSIPGWGEFFHKIFEFSLSFLNGNNTYYSTSAIMILYPGCLCSEKRVKTRPACYNAHFTFVKLKVTVVHWRSERKWYLLWSYIVTEKHEIIRGM